jgi:hypothetical protein
LEPGIRKQEQKDIKQRGGKTETIEWVTAIKKTEISAQHNFLATENVLFGTVRHRGMGTGLMGTILRFAS